MKAQKYVGIANVCSIEDMPRVMKNDFEELYAFMKEKGLSMERVPFTIYNTFDIFKKETSYVACIPLDEEVETDASWVKGSTKALNTLKTIHKGRYENLGNGWMTAMSFVRMKKIKVANTPVGFEYYLNNPYDTPAQNLVTEIFIPLQ